MSLNLNSKLLVNFLLPKFLKAGNTGTGVDRKTYCLLLGLKGTENLLRNQNKD